VSGETLFFVSQTAELAIIAVAARYFALILRYSVKLTCNFFL